MEQAQSSLLTPQEYLDLIKEDLHALLALLEEDNWEPHLSDWDDEVLIAQISEVARRADYTLEQLSGFKPTGHVLFNGPGLTEKVLSIRGENGEKAKLRFSLGIGGVDTVVLSQGSYQVSVLLGLGHLKAVRVSVCGLNFKPGFWSVDWVEGTQVSESYFRDENSFILECSPFKN